MTHIKLENGAKLLKSVQFPHKDDHFLHLVLADTGRGIWATWMYNETCSGCYAGSYFDSEAEAHADFVDRVVTTYEQHGLELLEAAA